VEKLQKKFIISVNGPVVESRGDGDFAMHDMVYVGEHKIIGEVIKLDKEIATIQVYEETSGLRIGEEVIGTEAPLSITLGPGIIGNVFDGIERPLKALQEASGNFLEKGNNIDAIDRNSVWHFIPKIDVGSKVNLNTILGEVKETEVINNRIMNPFNINGEVTYIADEGDYKAEDIIAKVKCDSKEYEITMIQKWPVRIQRPYKERLTANIPLITGQRVIDTLFPIAKGGTAMIPGGFGTGKTMLQHQIAKWSDSDIIVYIGCGERGNEMTEVLEDFPKLIDPKTNRPLMERTILIANTSNMPVAARETSIYTGITIAEYYRDMGYNVAIMADSTSRWAEALREISGRLEEMPAEEGYPSYLPSRLSQVYGRAGLVKGFNDAIGSVSMIGAVSPQGSDFSEPVTQNTKRFVHVFWGLDKELAYSRHYPAVNWKISYSDYVDRLQDWYEKNINEKFPKDRIEIVKLLQEENELQEIAKVVGQDVLSDTKKLILETCRAIRLGFLQQSAVNENDTYVPLEKQYKMMSTILNLYTLSLKLVEKGVPLSRIKGIGLFDEYIKLKFNVRNDQLYKFEEFFEKISKELKAVNEEYNDHLGT
jgi:V/A-type H+-transporting ATPase subunit A